MNTNDKETCPKCFGTGLVLYKKGTKSKKCNICEGAGTITKEFYKIIEESNFKIIR